MAAPVSAITAIEAIIDGKKTGVAAALRVHLHRHQIGGALTLSVHDFCHAYGQLMHAALVNGLADEVVVHMTQFVLERSSYACLDHCFAWMPFDLQTVATDANADADLPPRLARQFTSALVLLLVPFHPVDQGKSLDLFRRFIDQVQMPLPVRFLLLRAIARLPMLCDELRADTLHKIRWIASADSPFRADIARQQQKDALADAERLASVDMRRAAMNDMRQAVADVEHARRMHAGDDVRTKRPAEDEDEVQLDKQLQRLQLTGKRAKPE